MAQTVRIGLIGAGFMGQKAHLENYVTIPECKIVALAEGREATARQVADRFGIEHVYPHHRAMLAAEELDAVVAIMPYRLYHAVVPEVLQAGLSLLTEKPMCLRTDTARGLAELADRQGVVYYVGYMKRSLPATQEAVKTLRQWKASGEVGAMRYLRAVMPPGNWTFDIERPVSGRDEPVSYEGEAPEAPPEHLSPEMQRKYDSFVNYYIHQVNLIRYLLGEDWHVTHVDPTEAVLAGESESGVPVVLEMQGYGLRNGWEESYRVVFEGGKVDLSVPAPLARQRGGELEIFSAATQTSVQPILPPHWCFLEQARHFVRCLRGEDTPRVSVWDAVKDLEVADGYVRMLERKR